MRDSSHPFFDLDLDDLDDLDDLELNSSSFLPSSSLPSATHRPGDHIHLIHVIPRLQLAAVFGAPPVDFLPQQVREKGGLF